MSRRILIIEDEPGLRVALSDRLVAEGYEVDTEADGDSGFSRAVSGGFDLIVLDLMLPKRSGLDICRELRHGGDATPILMLTALAQTADKVAGLRLGADDYLSKPFEMPELLARIEALLRRGAGRRPGTGERQRAGPVEADFRRGEVLCDGQPVQLSAKELQLLRYFMEHRGETLSREELLRHVWGYEAMPTTRTVDVHVAWLRQKLQPASAADPLILTVHGVGYKFVG